MPCACSCRCGACKKDACECPCHVLDELNDDYIVRLLLKHGVKRNTNEMSKMSRSKLFKLIRRSKHRDTILKAGVRKVQNMVRRRNSSVTFASLFEPDETRKTNTPEPKTATTTRKSVLKDDE